jgi:Tfp pilus assembly protein PilN
VHAVNLLPRQLEVAPERRVQHLALAGAAAVPVIAMIFVVIGYSSAHSTVAAEQAKFAALQTQIAALGGVTSAAQKPVADTAAVAQLNGLIAERTARRVELDGVLSQELPWDSMLRDVARILPDDVWLTALSVQSPVTFGTASPAAAPPAAGSSTSAAANNLTIAGFGVSAKSIALLLVRLRLLPTLSNVTLGTTTSSTVGAKAVVQFSVTAAIQAPAGARLPVTASPVPATTTTTPAAG